MAEDQEDMVFEVVTQPCSPGIRKTTERGHRSTDFLAGGTISSVFLSMRSDFMRIVWWKKTVPCFLLCPGKMLSGTHDVALVKRYQVYHEYHQHCWALDPIRPPMAS